MRVLIACEESQAVCKAFRELGHEAQLKWIYEKLTDIKNEFITAVIQENNGSASFLNVRKNMTELEAEIRRVCPSVTEVKK